jgi:methionyl-tRNA formyltransferase
MTELNANKLRVVFMGTSNFARQILYSLVDAGYKVEAIFTRPDLPQGRNQEIRKSPVKEEAEKNNIPVFEPFEFDEKSVGKIQKIKPDIIIVAAYGKILPRNVLEIPKYGSLNVHASLLPRYRGPSPIQNAILTGEKETGVTIILMNEGIDTGEIIVQEKTGISPDDNAKTLLEKLAQIGTALLAKTIPEWIEKKITLQKQDESQATVCQLIERDDGRIIWEEDAEIIYNKYRAFYPWPGIYSFWKNDGNVERIKLLKITLEKRDPETRHKIGEIFEIGEKVGIKAGGGVIIVEEIQPEGKKPMEIRDFINGHKNFAGSILS